MMKNILLFISVAISLNNIGAQTYISSTIGYDFANVNTPQILNYINLWSKKYDVRGVTIGAKIKQKINSKFDIVVYSSFSNKYSEAFIFGIAPYEGVKFNYFQNSLQVNYNYKNYFCALGGNINVLSNWSVTKDKKAIDNYSYKIPDKGIRAAIGKYYKKFCIEAYFYKGLTSSSDPWRFELLPVNSFGVLLSYDIKVFGGFKKKTKTDCPKF